MLHLNFGLSFEALADKLMTGYKAAWENPFAPPVIVFPDPNLEHWFKLKWMQKYGALANLNTQFLDKFLFQVLNHKNHSKTMRLSGDIIRNLILSWCMQTTQEEKACWNYLGSEPGQYLQADDSGRIVDEARLFDFANQMTSVFMNYETSRPGAFKTKEGLIQTWASSDPNALFFNHAHEARERWQRCLYQRIFLRDDSILRRINEQLDKEYLTVPQLYEKCRTKTGNIQFAGANDQPVFIFWNAGLGQFYRVALHEYSKEHEVYAYIQNPCMEFWEDATPEKLTFKHRLVDDTESYLDETNPDDHSDEFGRTPENENQLLVKWGRGGRENIKLWCESVDYDFDFHEDYQKFAYQYQWDEKHDSQFDNALHTLQTLIAERKNISGETPIVMDESLSVTSAPSRIREIEHLHTEICKLLKPEGDKPGANIRDILVVAPDMNIYRSAIHQVFAAEQSMVEENKEKKRNKEEIQTPALYLPFTIIDGCARESLTARAIDALFRMMNTHSLSRLEFFELVRNPLVQHVRNISPDEISLWENWLTNMQVFRDREILGNENAVHYDDWKTGLKRLLLARLTDCRVNDGDEVLHPYADLNSNDDASLCRFIEAVESLEAFIQKCGEYREGLSRDALENWFIPTMNSWISMSSVPRELNAEMIIYKNIADSLENLKFQYIGGLEKVSLKCLELTIRNAAEGTDYTTGSLFVNGLTFMNFTANRIIPIKHIFFLGMDSASFPGRDIPNSLDLRNAEPWPGDNKNAYKNRYAFLCQLMSTTDSMHFSYVNKNLQKDEDFFPSSVLNDLFGFCHDEKWAPHAISIDETRPISDLFTARAYRNHCIHQCMTHGSHETVVYEDTPIPNLQFLPDRVSLSKIKKYLEDPFQLRVSELLQTQEEDEDPERIVYEPITIDDIELLSTIKAASQVIIHHAYETVPEGGFTKDNVKDECNKIVDNDIEAKNQIDAIVKSFMAELRESGFRAASLYEKIIQERILKGAKSVASSMLQIDFCDADDDNAIDLILEQDIQSPTAHTAIGTLRKRWLLQGQAEPHVWRENELMITSVVLKESADCYKFLKAFVSALALILKRGREEQSPNKVFSVKLFICGISPSSSFATKDFVISAEEAEKILTDIYQYAFIEQYAVAAPMKLLEDKKSKKQIDSFDTLKKELNDPEKSPWRFFKKGKIFNLDTDIGYQNDSTFPAQWESAQERQLGLIKLLNPNRACDAPA